jgi:hypothetical protein
VHVPYGECRHKAEITNEGYPGYKTNAKLQFRRFSVLGFEFGVSSVADHKNMQNTYTPRPMNLKLQTLHSKLKKKLLFCRE